MQVKPKSSTQKVVYFVRHGQSEDNIGDVFQRPDSPLSEVGKQQAQFIAKRIASIEYDALIASPLRRTTETAEAIAALSSKPIEYSELFVERIKPSSINGKLHSDNRANDVWRAWEKSLITPGKERIEDGENYEDITKRAAEALDYLYNHEAKTLVVVTHGYILRTMVASVLFGKEIQPDIYKNFQRVVSMENTGVTALVYEAAFEQEACWRLWTYNDHAHLAV